MGRSQEHTERTFTGRHGTCAAAFVPLPIYTAFLLYGEHHVILYPVLLKLSVITDMALLIKRTIVISITWWKRISAASCIRPVYFSHIHWGLVETHCARRHAEFCAASWTCNNLEVSKKSALVVWSHWNVLLSFLEKLECLSPNVYSFSVEGILNLQGVPAVSRKCFSQKDRNVGVFFFLWDCDIITTFPPSLSSFQIL